MGTVKGLCSGTGALLRGSLWKANICLKRRLVAVWPLQSPWSVSFLGLSAIGADGFAPTVLS